MVPFVDSAVVQQFDNSKPTMPTVTDITPK